MMIKPFHPIPYKNGNKVVRSYTEDFTDKVGNKANITYVDFKDKKGRLNERFVMFVKWVV